MVLHARTTARFHKDLDWEGGEGVLVGGASRSKRLARVVVVCARGSMRVSELAAVEDTLADRPREDLEPATIYVIARENVFSSRAS
jgi:hypothetical protein